MLKTCEYCTCLIEENEPHTYCEEKLRIEDEETAAWEEYYDLQQTLEDEILSEHQQFLEDQYQKAHDNDFCPCGHNHTQHYMYEGYCVAGHCDCPQFGEPVENWEIYTITNVGGDPGGFIICE